MRPDDLMLYHPEIEVGRIRRQPSTAEYQLMTLIETLDQVTEVLTKYQQVLESLDNPEVCAMLQDNRYPAVTQLLATLLQAEDAQDWALLDGFQVDEMLSHLVHISELRKTALAQLQHGKSPSLMELNPPSPTFSVNSPHSDTEEPPPLLSDQYLSCGTGHFHSEIGRLLRVQVTFAVVIVMVGIVCYLLGYQ